MGWLGACIGTAPCNINVSAPASVSATFAPDTVLPHVDIDGNGNYDALTDGLLIFRYLLGMAGMTEELVQHMDNIRPLLDVDGNGKADGLTDGLLLIRYLFGLRGPPLIAGAVGAGATRTTAAEIGAYIQSLMP
jgi:hypothetical protein